MNIGAAAENTARLLGCIHERCPQATLCSERCVKAHNNPPVKLELDRDLAEFIVENVDANIPICLNAMSHFSATRDRDGAQKAVDMLDKYRKIKKAIEEAMR